MKVKTETFLATLKDEKGQNLVEFALVVPILLLLVLGIAEFGRAWMTKNILTGAAREAVRVAAVGGNGVARGDNVLVSANLPGSTIVTDGTDTEGNPMKIATVTYIYNFFIIMKLVPGIPDNVTLLSTTTMRTE